MPVDIAMCVQHALLQATAAVNAPTPSQGREAHQPCFPHLLSADLYELGLGRTIQDLLERIYLVIFRKIYLIGIDIDILICRPHVLCPTSRLLFKKYIYKQKMIHGVVNCMGINRQNKLHAQARVQGCIG